MKVNRLENDSQYQLRELTAEERNLLEKGKSDPIPPAAALGLSAGAILICLLMWLFYWIFKDSLWLWSLDCSKYWSQTGGYWTVHFWLFSGPIYIWWFILVGVLLLLSPSKESSVRSILILFVSVYTHIHIRIWSRASRPKWENSRIVMRTSCDCSFGMPSWQSHIGTLLWSLLVYELAYKTKHFTKAAKFTWIGVASFIILNIVLAQIFYGDSSVPQAFIGAFHGLAWFSLGLVFDFVFQKFMKSLLEGNRKYQLVLVGIGLAILASNTILWYAFYESSIETIKITHERCFDCFREGNWGIRNQVARTLAFSNMFFGIALGLLVANPNYDGANDFMLANHLSMRGLMRVGLMAALHLPLIFIFFWDFRPNNTFWFNSLFWILTGFLITFVDIRLNNLLNWNFNGDIYPLGEATSTGAEGQALLDSKLHYDDPKTHFNPYKKALDPRTPNATGPNQSTSPNFTGSINLDHSGKRPPAQNYNF